VQAGECLRIMTGAMMPDGLDTVVPQEFTQAEGAHIHIPPDLLRPGDNRRFAGEDLMQGAVALAAGTRLGPAALGLLASLGLARVQVLRRLRVAYFSTGDEILSLGEAPREGAVYDSNRFTLLGLLARLGVQAIDLGVVRDEPAALRQAFADAARQADAVITSGGEKSRHYTAALMVAALAMGFGLLAPLFTRLLLGTPPAFIAALAGLAMVRVLQTAFQISFRDKFSFGALICFLVTVADVPIFHIGAPFWGLVFGLASAWLLERRAE